MSPSRILRTSLFGLCVAALASCREASAPKTPAAPAADVVLEIDGIRVTRAEIEDWYPYLEALDPRLGKGFRVRQVLEQQLLPMKFAQRYHAVHRSELATRAEALVKVAPTLSELVTVSKTAEDPKERGYTPERATTRSDLPLALARAIFDPTKLGQVQGPIETPQGFAVVANRTITKGVTAFEDRADPWIVLFNTHMSREFEQWWSQARASVGSRLTFVHEDFKDCLPDWIHS